jgi:hypothetical protein
MREKKRRKKIRAALSGDLSALENLAQRAPLTAVEPCVARLADGDAAVLEVARSLAAALRKSGKHGEVLRLVAADTARDTRLALEGALAAFAAGDDVAAAELATGAPALRPIVEPLLAAARGERPARAKRGESGKVRAISLAAAAGGHARHGDKSAMQRALRELAATGSQPLREGALRAAGSLASALRAEASDARRTRDALRQASALLGDAPAAARSALAMALAGEALAAPAEVRTALGAALARHAERHGLSREVAVRAAELRLSAVDTGDVQRVPHLLAELGVNAFCAEQRGSARLFAGFGLIGRDAPRALREFDQAVAEGADLGEALRGRWLALERVYLTRRDDPSAAELSRSAERLLSELQRAGASSHDAALALATETLKTLALAAALGLDTPQQQRLAREWLDRVGTLRAERTLPASTENELDLVEACLYRAEPARSLRAAERVLERAPLSLPAWSAKIAAATRAGDPRAEDFSVEAWRVTGDERFAPAARAILRRRGELEGLESVATKSAGTLALECLTLLAERGASALEALYLEALPLAAALGKKERAAFDSAILAAVLADENTAARALATIASRSDDPATLARSLGILVNTDSASVLEAGARRLAVGPERSNDVRPLSELVAALAAIDTSRARKLVLSLAPSLERRAVDAVQHGLVLGRDAEFYETAFDELHDLLHPEVCLDQLIEVGASVGARDPEDDRETAVDFLSTALGLPRAAFESMPMESLDRIGCELMRAVDAGGANRQELERIRRMARQLAKPYAPATFPSAAPEMKKLSKSERNKKKRARRGRD